MLILSTFTSDFLKSPLESLFQKFTSESVTIEYSNKNLMGDLLSLNSNLEKSYAILLRLFDLIEVGSIIDKTRLSEHLDLILTQIIKLKQEQELPFIVALCPSPSATNSQFQIIEKLFIEKLNENKIHTLTLTDVQEKYGVVEFENPIGDDTHTPYSPKFYTAIACLLARKLHAIIQKPFKAIVVDCDNTLWTGVAADDGTEGIVFKDHNILLQNYLVEQQAKGKIICLCSKNEEQTVLDVFNQRQAEMPLKLKQHISKYKINWEIKSENIKELALDLNLFPNSFRFIDDNPIEIDDVSQIPGILCIAMPQNLEEFKNNWAFDIDEHLVVTETDKKRTEFYKQAEIKAALATRFHDPVEYLRSPELGQTIIISEVNSIDSEDDVKVIERIRQLSEKTNQFNLFPEPRAKEINEINAIVKNSNERKIFVGSIKDNFSAEDITAIAISSLGRNSLTINSFFVSCRIFRRGMEYKMLKHIAQFSQERGLKNIKLKFKKSAKNNPASSFLNILSDKTNRDPISRFLFNKSENYVWIHEGLKSLFKKINICLDFNSLALNDEFILTLSTRKIIELETDSLTRASLGVSQKSSKEEQQNKLILPDNNNISEKYLIELKQITTSLLKEIYSSLDLENEIIQICNDHLGNEGQNKSLVARGLDSLKATEIRYYLYKFYGVNVTIQKILCEKTTINCLIEYIKEQKRTPKIIVQNDNFYNLNQPSSFQQQRIWFAEQQESADNSANYHMTACYKVGKNLDIQRFKKACQELIKLYDVFGTTFFMQDNELKQLILFPRARELNFQVKNLKNETFLEEAIQREINMPWTMSSAPLIRFIVFEDQIEKKYYIFFHVHHAIFDAVSLKNCLDSLSKIYQNIDLLDSPPQYIEFIQYQQNKLKDEAYQTKAFNFWKDTLSKIETITTLPYDKSISTFKLATELVASRFNFTLPFQDLATLKILAQSTGVTCFSAINALFSLLICSYTYQEHITLITATNGRSGHPSFDKMVGFFVNLLVQQFDLKKNERFVDYLKNANKKILASQEFQDIPFSKIQEILYAQGVKNILLSPAFIYQSYAIPELRLDNETAELEVPKYPIIFDRREVCRFGHFTLFAQESEQELIFIIEYAQDLFSLSFIESFAKNFLHTIREVCKNPNYRLQEISTVCDEERSQLISLGQGPQLQYAENDNLVKKFQRIVERYPDNDALCYGEIHFSYKEVDQQSTNLSHALIKAGVRQGNYVGIFLEGNHLFFVAELSVLKIGAVFIPLSKEDPYERLKSIIDDANIQFFIVDDTPKDLFDTDFQSHQLISISAIKIQSLADNLPLLATSMGDSACIFYTSGSTGKPKGVIIKQKAILRVVESPNYLEINAEDKISQTANQAFDAAQLECWLAWNNGASLVVFDKNTFLDATKFEKNLFYEEISIMWFTVALFHQYAYMYPSTFTHLKYLITGGDVIEKKAVECILNYPDTKIKHIIEAYGPTETGIFTSTCLINREVLKNYNKLPIGRPINNTEVYLLTRFNQLVPMGGVGVLFIGGDGVGAYLNRPLLQESFLLQQNYSPNILYNSGDLAKWGTIKNQEQMIFEGRINDQQIKIQGIRADLSEIENALSQHPAIKQVIVLKNKEKKILIAFYIKNETFPKLEKNSVTQYLSHKLQPCMIPTYYEEVRFFPTTRNGKLDKKILLQSKLTDESNSSVALTTNEDKLLEIFIDILKLKIGVEDNFFYYGAVSIQIVQLITEIEQIFHKRISFDVFRKNPTVRALNLYLELEQLPENDSISELKAGSLNAPPIVFIHPAGGGLFCFNKLIESLKEIGLPNPCYGIEDPVILDRKVKALTIPEMASQYLEYIQEKIKDPFILAGYSFGGLVALEMAAQLESENKNILGIILLDTWVVSFANADLQQALRSEVLKYCEEMIKQAHAHKKAENVESLIIPLVEQCKYYQEIGFKFTPKTVLSTPAYLFQAKELDKFVDMHKKTKSNYLNESVKNLSIVQVEGNHFNLLENSSNLSFLAKQIGNSVLNIPQKPQKILKTNLNLPFFPLVDDPSPILVSNRLNFE